MKNIKSKAALVASLMTLFAVSVSAQPQARKAPRGKAPMAASKVAEMSTDRLDQRLDLTDAQESKIYAINLRYAQDREKARETAREARPKAAGEEKAKRPTREEMRVKQEAAKAQRKAHTTDIMAVLTDSQKVDYAMMLGASQAKAHKAKATAKSKSKRAQHAKQNKGGKKVQSKK